MLYYTEEKMARQMKEDIPYCAKCDEEMQEVMLPKYEYEEGYMLHNASAYRCNTCGKVFFTEEQANEMKAMTNELKEHSFGFERKIIVSGKSLVIGIPHELAEHLKFKQGQKVKIFPLAQDGLMVRKA